MNKREDIFEKLIDEPRLMTGLALDLGCGSGSYSIHMANRGFVVHAVDESAVKVAPLRENKLVTSIVVHIEDITRFKISPKTFNLIIARNVFPFIKSKEAVKEIITRAANGLVPGGEFAFTLFGPKDDWAKNTEMSFFENEEILPLLKNLGLSIVEKDEYIGQGYTMNKQLKNWHIHTYVTQK